MPSTLFCSVNKRWRIHWNSSKAQLLLTNVSSQMSKHYSGKRTRNSYEWCSLLLLDSFARSSSYHPTNPAVYYYISISFCMTNFSGSLNSFRVLLPVMWQQLLRKQTILAPTPPCRKPDLCAHDFAPSPDLLHQPRFATITCPWTWRLCGNNPAMQLEFLLAPIIISTTDIKKDKCDRLGAVKIRKKNTFF